MALNTFTDLSQGLQNWMEDDDSVEFVGDIPDVIDLAEKRVLRDLDLAIFRRTDSTTTLVVGTAQVTKPTIASPDLLIATKSIYLTGGTLGTNSHFLQTRSHEYLHDFNSGGNALPRFYGEVDESTWLIGSKPDETYTLNVIYQSRPDRLTLTNQTNWLSDNVYDFLFKAALAEAEKYLVADDRAPMWENDYMMMMPRVRIELYNQYGNQYDRLGAVPVPQQPRSVG